LRTTISLHMPYPTRNEKERTQLVKFSKVLIFAGRTANRHYLPALATDERRIVQAHLAEIRTGSGILNKKLRLAFGAHRHLQWFCPKPCFPIRSAHTVIRVPSAGPLLLTC